MHKKSIGTASVTTITTDNNQTNNTTTTTDNLCYQSDISVSVTDGTETLNAGQTTTYVATVTNNGPSITEDLTFEITYKSTDFENPSSVTSSQGTVGAPTTSTNNDTVTIAYTLSGSNLNSGQNLTISIEMQIKGNPVAPVSFTFEANPITPQSDSDCDTLSIPRDPNLTNNTDSDISVAVNTFADVYIQKTSTGGAIAGGSSGTEISTTGNLVSGDTGSYTITVTNLGPSIAEGITVIDNISDKLTPIDNSGNQSNYTASENWTCTFDNTSKDMICTTTEDITNGGNDQVILGFTIN